MRNASKSSDRSATGGITGGRSAILGAEATGALTATYTQKGGRKELAQDPGFIEAFTEAKSRIRNMDYRFVEETDGTRQALLEIYCSVALGTPYNDFRTH